MQENNLIIVVCSYSISPEILINKFTKIAKKYHLKFRGVIITNNIKYNTNQNIDNWLISSGSNSILDFSAYFEGIELINDKISNNSHILFFNDTLLLKHDFNFSLNEIFKYIDLMNEIEVESIIGYKSNYNSI
jgi:HJR/Mrr/RecB family endonuclease